MTLVSELLWSSRTPLAAGRPAGRPAEICIAVRQQVAVDLSDLCAASAPPREGASEHSSCPCSHHTKPYMRLGPAVTGAVGSAAQTVTTVLISTSTTTICERNRQVPIPTHNVLRVSVAVRLRATLLR